MSSRPEKVHDALALDDQKCWVGTYGGYLLHSAYQPIVRKSADDLFQFDGFEGLIRGDRSGVAVMPDQLFASVEQGDQLFVHCMCMALHIRNFHLVQPGNGRIYINNNPDTFGSVESLEREFAYLLPALERNGLRCNQLVLEILEVETLSLAVLERMIAIVRDAGISLAMDDFGQEFSNFQRYRKLRPDLVKFDRLLFQNLKGSKPSRSLLANMVRTFHENGTEVLCEGLETKEDLEVAALAGFDLFQGYAISPPRRLPGMFNGVYPFALANAVQLSQA
ncbi:MAG: EAL domain-containing protein [Rhizobiaceae bacterium]